MKLAEVWLSNEDKKNEECLKQLPFPKHQLGTTCKETFPRLIKGLHPRRFLLNHLSRRMTRLSLWKDHRLRRLQSGRVMI